MGCRVGSGVKRLIGVRVGSDFGNNAGSKLAEVGKDVEKRVGTNVGMRADTGVGRIDGDVVGKGFGAVLGTMV